MAPRLQILVCAICVLSIFNVVASADPEFPTLNQLVLASYTTEVQVTDVGQQDTGYAIEYYDKLSDAGKLEMIVEGKIIQVYYNKETNLILEVTGSVCHAWDITDSQYSEVAAFYGWLIKEPLIIGPSAPLWYAQTRRNDIRYVGKETVRDIPCDHWELDIIKKGKEYVTMNYYFAPEKWTTPYQRKDLRVPIRIQALGNSSKESDVLTPINVVTDFAYFQPSVSAVNLEPAVGIGCSLRPKADNFPDIPTTFQYSAEVVDLLYEENSIDLDVKFERVWYDGKQNISRFDIYKKTTSSSSFQDYNTGVMYEFTKEHKCTVRALKNAFSEKYETGMVGKMKTAKEVLNLDGDFYFMGIRKIRGILCDTFESVREEEDIVFKGKELDKLVVTAYFSEDFMQVSANGEEQSNIPIVILLTGWNSDKKVLQVQYNIMAFDDYIFPEMYSNFGMEMCYMKAESKTYVVLMLEPSTSSAAMMEDQDELIVKELRALIAKHAKIPPWRIPFLQIDYQPVGVFATALMVERPPTLLQFTQFDSGEQKAYKNQIGMVDAATLEDCANACIDFEEPCKGFYFCNAACFVKLDDPTETHDPTEETVVLGQCDEYIRAERDSTNFGNTPLKKALEMLEKAVFDQSIEVIFEVKRGIGMINVSDISIGPGPYTGVDTADKPYVINVEYRKLDVSLMTSTTIKGVEMLNDCYKKCKAAGSQCASFSFCGRSKNPERECIISSEMVIRGKTNDLDLIPSSECDIYDLKFLEYFTKYPEHVSFISGYQVNKDVKSVEECAKQCRMEEKGKCRAFEYCRHLKSCSLHTKHILDLKPGEKGTSTGENPCVHYAARFVADFDEMGLVLVDDSNNVRYDISLEECSRVCSEELGDSCRSFNYCPTGRGTCELSRKVLKDTDVKTREQAECRHYEKKDGIQDWGNSKVKDLEKAGWTSKGFTGLVLGMLAFGLIIGAVGFVLYSYMRSKRTGEGVTVRFMKQET